MHTPDTILATKKPDALRQYLRRVGDVALPKDVKIPQDPREAMLLGMRMARRPAYEDGLVDGVSIGAGVVLDAFDGGRA